MKSFREHIQERLAEATIMKVDRVEGFVFIWNGTGTKAWESKMNEYGYTKGHRFTVISKPKASDVDVSMGSGPFEKYLKSEDGKIFHLSGGESYGSAWFSHDKAAGSPPSGAEWESLVVFAYNVLNKVPNDDEKVNYTWDQYSDKFGAMAEDIAKDLSAKIKAKKLVQTGSGGIGSITLGKYWKEAGAKDKTPKTDIASGDFKNKISLKKEGGSQLMSAGKEESIAIVNAALGTLGLDKKWAGGLLSAMESNMTKLVTKETVGDVEKRYKAGERDEFTTDWEKKDKQNKELSSMLNEYMNDPKNGAKFTQHIIWEAATGNEKFGGADSKAAANSLGEFDLNTRKMKFEDISHVDAKLIKDYVKLAKPYVAFKKSGATSPAYSTMRISIGAGKKKKNEDIQHEEYEYIPTFSGIIAEEIGNISEINQYLTEDLLIEGPMNYLRKARDVAKDLGSSFVNKLKAAIQVVIKKIGAALKKIASLGKLMFEKLMMFMGVTIDTVANIPGIINL